jgi:serine/threonine protein kinase
VFLKNGVPKIADYGFSKMMDEPKEKVYYNVGTPLYMCPQSIMQNKYSEKSDIWSLGVIFYEMLYGAVPWNAPSEKDLAKVITQTPVTFSSTIPVSEEAKSFIRECLLIEEE